MNALIIVDVQNDFLPGGALPVNEGDIIIPVINNIQKDFDLVVATQDWHPPNHKSFASQHNGKNIFEEITLNGSPQVLWPDHCVVETAGARFSVDLEGQNIEGIFRKGMEKDIDSYSGFFDNGKKKATGLGAYLKGRGITSIFVAGLAADYCVYFTALDGLELGFDSTIITDATRAINAHDFETKLQYFKSRGGKETMSNNSK